MFLHILPSLLSLFPLKLFPLEKKKKKVNSLDLLQLALPLYLQLTTSSISLGFLRVIRVTIAFAPSQGLEMLANQRQDGQLAEGLRQSGLAKIVCV